MRWSLFVLILTGGMIAWGCKEERVVVVDDLIGTWEVQAAERNGRSTETLNGALFEFREDGSMMTNISGQEDEGMFTFTNMGIDHEAAMSAHYQIEEFETDSMRLAVVLHRMLFAFELHRMETE